MIRYPNGTEIEISLGELDYWRGSVARETAFTVPKEILRASEEIIPKRNIFNQPYRGYAGETGVNLTLGFLGYVHQKFWTAILGRTLTPSETLAAYLAPATPVIASAAVDVFRQARIAEQAAYAHTLKETGIEVAAETAEASAKATGQSAFRKTLWFGAKNFAKGLGGGVAAGIGADQLMTDIRLTGDTHTLATIGAGSALAAHPLGWAFGGGYKIGSWLDRGSAHVFGKPVSDYGVDYVAGPIVKAGSHVWSEWLTDQGEMNRRWEARKEIWWAEEMEEARAQRELSQANAAAGLKSQETLAAALDRALKTSRKNLRLREAGLIGEDHLVLKPALEIVNELKSSNAAIQAHPWRRGESRLYIESLNQIPEKIPGMMEWAYQQDLANSPQIQWELTGEKLDGYRITLTHPKSKLQVQIHYREGEEPYVQIAGEVLIDHSHRLPPQDLYSESIKLPLSNQAYKNPQENPFKELKLKYE